MTTLREAATMALEALEWFNKYGSEEHGPSLRGAEFALRAALAQPTSCAYPNCLGGTVGTFCHDACLTRRNPLVTPRGSLGEEV